MSANPSEKSEKSATTALLLCLFLGGLGAHRFYVGKIGTGFLMLVTLGGCGIWALVDLITISYVRFKDKNDRYVEFTRYEGSMVSKVLKIFGIIFAGLIAFVFFVFMLVMLLTGDMVAVARNQLTALHNGDFETAYSYGSPEFKEATSLDEFKSVMEKFPAIMHYKDVTFSNRAFDNNNGQLEGTIYGSDGSSAAVHYDLVKVDGKWKISNMGIDRLDKPKSNETE